MAGLPVLLPSIPRAGGYRKAHFLGDVIAAVIVAIMLIPQSLAYALLAGMPAEVGLYASILPLVLYAVLGTSSTLSVGPVAITSLMTAAALSDVAAQGTGDYLAAAVTLAALSGAMLFACGVLRLGILANFLSHAVVQAFVTASAIVFINSAASRGVNHHSLSCSCRSTPSMNSLTMNNVCLSRPTSKMLTMLG